MSKFKIYTTVQDEPVYADSIRREGVKVYATCTLMSNCVGMDYVLLGVAESFSVLAGGGCILLIRADIIRGLDFVEDDSNE